MRSCLSFGAGIPANAIALPGAKPAGDFNHLSKLPAVHFMVAFEDRDDE